MIPSQPLSSDLAHREIEAFEVLQWLSIGILTVVVSVHLFVNVPEQVERLDTDVCAAQTAF
jgi:hypothetical protein